MFPAKIVLATDGSEGAALAARAAVDLSKRTGSELHAMHAWSTRFESYIRAQLKQEAQNLLAEQVKRIKDTGGDVVQAHLKEGHAIDEILDLAEEIGAGLIVMGSRGLGPVKRLVVGSVSEGVVHRTSHPVLVHRGGESAWPPRRIIVGEDGSLAAKGAAELAARIGKLFGAKVFLVRVYPTFPKIDVEGREFNARMVDDELRREERALEERAKEIEECRGSRPTLRVVVGDAEAELLEAAEEGDTPEKVLLAVGSRGLGAIERMRLGSVSTKVLHAAKGPVLIYQHENKD